MRMLVYYVLMNALTLMNLSCDTNLVFDENVGILCVNECVNDWWISSCDTNLVFDENAGILCVNECITFDESLHVTLI